MGRLGLDSHFFPSEDPSRNGKVWRLLDTRKPQWPESFRTRPFLNFLPLSLSFPWLHILSSPYLQLPLYVLSLFLVFSFSHTMFEVFRLNRSPKFFCKRTKHYLMYGFKSLTTMKN